MSLTIPLSSVDDMGSWSVIFLFNWQSTSSRTDLPTMANLELSSKIKGAPYATIINHSKFALAFDRAQSSQRRYRSGPGHLEP